MKLHSFQDNLESLVLSISDQMLRFDLHHQSIDLLYTKKFAHQKVITAYPLLAVPEFDVDTLLHGATQLLKTFTIRPDQLHHVYRHDRNDRFVLIEGPQGRKLELDKELNGIKDRSSPNYGNMYKRKPDNYYRDSVIREYLRINHDQKRAFEACLKMIHFLNQKNY